MCFSIQTHSLFKIETLALKRGTTKRRTLILERVNILIEQLNSKNSLGFDYYLYL